MERRRKNVTKKTRYILTMKSGREIPVMGMTGRYYVTRESQYRKNNPDNKAVRAATDEECDALIEKEERKSSKRGK